MQLRPNYIANIKGKPTTCKHGPSECAGDKQQLCVLDQAKFEAFWAFLQCQDTNVTAIGEPAWAEHCLAQLELGPAVLGRIQHCYAGSRGDSLLANSAHRTITLGVKASW